MDKKDHAQIDATNLRWGSVHLTLFILLIIGGIVTKRVYGHPEFMMLFHGPAAVFLVVGGLRISAKQRRRFTQLKVD